VPWSRRSQAKLLPVHRTKEPENWNPEENWNNTSYVFLYTIIIPPEVRDVGNRQQLSQGKLQEEHKLRDGD